MENFLSTALHYDNNNPDALIQYSNLRILRCRDAEALSYMDKVLNQVENCVLNNLENYPDHEILINLSKNYIELENYHKAIKALDVLVKLDDENLENWYLLAFSHYKLMNNKFAMKCLKNLAKVSEKTKITDNEELTNNKEFIDDNDDVVE